MSADLDNILNSTSWTCMQTEVANNFVTTVLLSNNLAEIAFIELDWNFKVLTSKKTKIDLNKFPLEAKEDPDGEKKHSKYLWILKGR